MKILTLEEACEYLKISQASICDLISSGDLPAAKISTRWLFREIDLENYVAEQVIIQTKERRIAYRSGMPPTIYAAVGPVRRGRKRRKIPVLPDLLE